MLKKIISIFSLYLMLPLFESPAKDNFDSLLRKSAEHIRAKKHLKADSILTLLLFHVDSTHSKLADLYYNKAIIRYYMNKFDSALYFLNFSTAYYIKINDAKNTLINKKWSGFIYKKKGFYQKSIFKYLGALNIAKDINNQKLIAEIQNSLGLLYKETKDYQKAIFNFENTLDYHKKSNNQKSQSIALNNLGICYHELNEYSFANLYYQKSIQLKKQISDNISISFPLLNLGELYSDINKLDSAKIFLKQSLDIREQINDKTQLVSVNNLLGEVYRRSKQYDSSQFYLLRANLLLQNIESRRHSIDHFKYQKALAYDLKDFQKTIYWDFKYDSLSKIYFEEERLKVQQISSDYTINEEKQKNEVLEIQKSQQEEIATLRLWIVLGLALLLLIAIYLFIQLKHKSKKISGLNSTLEQQNKTIKMLSRNKDHFSMNVFTEMKAMLAYQSSQQLNDADKITFNKVGSSINTTARLFELALKTKEESIKNKQLDAKVYLEGVVSDSLQIYGLLPHVKANIEIEPILCKSNDLHSLGQIVNELITNSAKYAFKDKEQSGALEITFKKRDELLELAYKDDGPGISESNKKDALGMSLINILTKSLNGKLVILGTEKGVHFRITFPIIK